MQYGKRILAMLLVLVTLVGMIPVTTSAAEPVSTQSDVSVSGTNEFGQMLSESISDAQQSQDAGVDDGKDGYGITALTIEGNVATVTYDAMEEAILLVALYSEENGTLLCSGKTTVTAETTEATLTIEGEMPEFFEASAFLLDEYDLSPLCASYATPMYTKQMQELLASKAEDYIADGYEVLQLDEEGDTNFAVYNKSVVVIDYQPGINEVVSADSNSGIYVFENCDEQITSLTAGTVVAYSYADADIYLIKISKIVNQNDQVLIYADTLELEEVFDYLKIETGSDGSRIEVDSAPCEEGVTYEGMVTGKPATRAWEDDATLKAKLIFSLEKEFKNEGDDQIGAEIKGSFGLSAEAKLSYYISLKRQFVELRMQLDITAEVELSGMLKTTPMDLTEFTLYTPIWGLTFECAPKIIWEFTVSCKISYTMTMVFGFSYDSDAGWQNLQEKPTYTADTSVEGKLFIGMDLTTSACILDDDIASVGFSLRGGLQITGKMTGTEHEEIRENAAKKHTCDECLALRFDWINRASVFMKFVKVLKAEYVFSEKTYYIGDIFISFDPFNKDAGFGKCPYYLYRVTVKVQDRNGDPVPGQEVFLSNGESLGKTGENGTLATYQKKGKYTFQTTIDGELLEVEREVTNATRVVLTNNPEILKRLADAAAEMIAALNVKNHATYKGGSGTFSSGVTWKIYRSGIMIIEGDGEMDSYSSSDIPWKNLKDKIKAVEFRGDVTNVSNYAFSGCYNLQTVILEDATVNIGYSAFQGCTGLKQIRLPANYQYSSSSFAGCSNVEKIQYGCPEDGIMPDRSYYSSGSYYYEYSLEYIARNSLDTVIFEEGIENVADYAFRYSYALQKVFLCSTISNIGYEAFYYSGITEIEFPESLTTIESCAFEYSSLTAVEFPESLESIGGSAFRFCYGLTEVVIPDHLAQSMGSGVFFGCSGLKKVTVPADLSINNVFGSCSNIESIRYTYGLTGVMTDRQRSNSNQAYYQTSSLEYACQEKLKYVTFDENITRIGNYAFYYCYALESVELPSTLKSIGYEAFYYTGITQIQLPESLTTIESCAFESSRLTAIAFRGNAPSINSSAFRYVTATVYYPASNATWTADKLTNYGGTLTWEAYTPEQKSIRTGGQSASSSASASQKPATKAIFGGEYSTVEIDDQIVHTAYFENLQPGEEYVMIALLDPNAEDLLAHSNLLAIMQTPAEADGTLAFDYIPRQDADVSYVFAAGASNQNLTDATITFPVMSANDQPQTIEPVVSYNGKVLTEELDYIILGDIDYTEAGEYTCYIRGIREYTGLVTCVYTVGIPVVSSWNITLGDNIGVNFVMNTDKEVAFTVAGEAVKAVQNSNTYSIHVAAAQMTDEIVITVDGTVLMQTYSVRQYADVILAGDYDENVKALVKAMLCYGGAAQTYFGYNTGTLASDGITITTAEPAGNAAIAISDSLDKLNFYGATLVHKNKTAVRFYFSGDVTNLTFSHGTATQKGDLFYIEVANIHPQNLGDTMEIIVTDSSGNTLTVVYSPLIYIVRMYEKESSDAATKMLVKALYNYYLAAATYCT